MLAKKYNPETAEKHWQDYWQRQEVFAFDPEAPGRLWSIDTPPPTVSGELHIGHVFSYTQAEIIARHRRMTGHNVFYPFGFDDNGLPTERLVEKELGIRGAEMSREEFNRLCMQTVEKYHKQFQDLWQSLGFSVDWSLAYSTISPLVQRISQRSFLDLYRQGKIYRLESPTLWCCECRTSIAQADLETRTRKTRFNYLNFEVEGKPLVIATTRPELLAACVAVLVHPEDNRHRRLVGKSARVPIYGHAVPFIADEDVDPEKGSGLVMVCTFGDQQDMVWQQRHKLPLHQIIEADGSFKPDVGIVGGLKITQARRAILATLQERGLLLEQSEQEQAVAVHERCGQPAEFLSTPQWFISLMAHKQELLAAGAGVKWYPDHMYQRFENWVNNLQWDWCISRQRFFGVPIPLWYCRACGEPIVAREDDLPVNPLTSSPKQTCGCGGTVFIPEADVLDTWATSSVTPQINSRWGEAEDRSQQLLPMAMRTQAHEIIRTWAFYTIAKSLFHTGDIPWREIMICGFVLAKKGEKISKSKANAASNPVEMIEEYSADVVRYWAASARLGSDISFSLRELEAGKRLTTKLWNAAKFSLNLLGDYYPDPEHISEPLDRWLLSRLSITQQAVSKSLDKYEVGLARETLEKFFWHDLCDNYLEIVKDRLYNPQQRGMGPYNSARATLHTAMVETLKMFAVFIPHITEEIFMQGFNNDNAVSLHILQWSAPEIEAGEFPGEALLDVISSVRKEKTTRGLSLATALSGLTIEGPEPILAGLKQAEADLMAVTKSATIQYTPHNTLEVHLEI